MSCILYSVTKTLVERSIHLTIDINEKGTKKGTSKSRRHVNTEMYMCESYGKQQVIYNLVIYKFRLKQLVQWTHSHYNHQHHHCLSKVLSLFDYSRCYVVKTKRSFYPLSWQLGLLFCLFFMKYKYETQKMTETPNSKKWDNKQF